MNSALPLKKSIFKKLSAFLTPVFTMGLLGFVAWTLYHHPEFSLSKLSRLELLAWFFLLPFISFFKLLAWQELTRGLDIKIPLLQAAKAWVLSTAGRYLPGKVFFVVGRISPYGPDKHRLARAGFAMALEFVIELCAAFCVLLAGLFFSSSAVLGLAFSPYVFWLLAGLLPLLIHPRSLNGLAKLFQKLRKKPAPSWELGWQHLLPTLGYMLIHWLVYLTAITLICSPLFAFSFEQVLLLGAGLALASLGGTLALIAPGGMGVREGLFAKWLVSLFAFSWPDALLIASLARIVQWSAELAGVLTYALFAIKAWAFKKK